MKSPITGLEMKLTKEQRSMIFRKETFDIVFHYYQCEDSGEQFTSAALDELNMNQVYNQYRDKLHQALHRMPLLSLILFRIPFSLHVLLIVGDHPSN